MDPVAWIVNFTPGSSSPPPVLSSSAAARSDDNEPSWLSSPPSTWRANKSPRTPVTLASPTILRSDENKAKAQAFNERLIYARRRLFEGVQEQTSRLAFELDAREAVAETVRARELRKTTEKASVVVRRARAVASRRRFEEALAKIAATERARAEEQLACGFGFRTHAAQTPLQEATSTTDLPSPIFSSLDLIGCAPCAIGKKDANLGPAPTLKVPPLNLRAIGGLDDETCSEGSAALSPPYAKSSKYTNVQVQPRAPPTAADRQARRERLRRIAVHLKSLAQQS
ncbi:hypothetical protein T492DRAFT_840060 [Pavlovales sp. CCMP2436]|nr:hypothetical protein T492DRAFT_840060 [Pavlovales sp. CCMP2436]